MAEDMNSNEESLGESSLHVNRASTLSSELSHERTPVDEFSISARRANTARALRQSSHAVRVGVGRELLNAEDQNESAHSSLAAHAHLVRANGEEDEVPGVEDAPSSGYVAHAAKRQALEVSEERGASLSGLAAGSFEGFEDDADEADEAEAEQGLSALSPSRGAANSLRAKAKLAGKAVLRYSAGVIEPGSRRDADAHEISSAYAAPRRARRSLNKAASRRVAKLDKRQRVHVLKAQTQSLRGHSSRALRHERKAAKAVRKLKRAEGIRRATSLKSIASLFLKAGLPALGIVLSSVFLLLMLSMCAGSQQTLGKWEDLTDSENAVALFLLAKGVDEVHVAAIMGNMSAESGVDPSAIEAGSGSGHGLVQWSFGRWNQLQAYAEAEHKDWTDVNLQLDFFWKEYAGDPADATFANYQWPENPETGFAYTHKDFEAQHDLADATVAFRQYFERAGVARDEVRISEAVRYYAILTSAPGGTGGLGQDYLSASEAQKSLVQSAYATPFVGDGLCATWITNLFNAGGFAAPGGNACDMARAWWCSSTDRSALKVGMVIAVEKSPYGLGQEYGHVGIYLGDNKVMSNASTASANAPNGCTIEDLDAWIEEYEYQCQARWGWALGNDLSKG